MVKCVYKTFCQISYYGVLVNTIFSQSFWVNLTLLWDSKKSCLAWPNRENMSKMHDFRKLGCDLG